MLPVRGTRAHGHRTSQVLRKYVQRGGKPDTAVELLADSYVGYAQMAQLTCQWLALATGEAPPEAVYSPEARTHPQTSSTVA